MAPGSRKRKAIDSSCAETSAKVPATCETESESTEAAATDAGTRDDPVESKKIKFDLIQLSLPNSNDTEAAHVIESVGEDRSANIPGTSAAPADNNNNTMANVFKILTWNVAGIRAAFKKTLPDFVKVHQPDIMCFTEVKALKEENLFKPAGYHIYWNASFAKKGYSGVGLFSKQQPIKVEYGIGHALDDEGRCIIAEYPTFKLALCYTPNAGENLKSLPRRMQWDAQFLLWVKKHIESGGGKPLIVTGDLNCAHLDTDVFDGGTNKKRAKSAGFTPEERDNFKKLLTEAGLVDLYRLRYPDEREKHFTFFSHRHGAKAKNAGWRLDYFLASTTATTTWNVSDKLLDVQVYREENSSDHVPLILTLKPL